MIELIVVALVHHCDDRPIAAMAGRIIAVVAPGTEFFLPETKPRIWPAPPARDRISKAPYQTWPANAGISRKVSGIRDFRDCVVGREA